MKKIYAIIFTSLASLSAQAQWTISTPMKEKRSEHVCVALPTGNVLVAGGWHLVNSKSSEIYNPVANTWTLVGSMSSFHSTAAATMLANGNVMIIGGYDGASNIGICELYDTTAKAWTTTGALSNGRSYHTATLLKNGKVLVVGGYNGTTNLTQCELYDPIVKTWSSAGNLTAGRSYHTATLLPSGKVLVTGGYNSTSFQLNSVEIYDPASNTWSAGPTMSSVRSRHGASLLASGKVMVSGGEFFNGGSPFAYNGLNSAEVFDPATSTWTPVANLPSGLCYNSQHTLPDGRVVVVAGLSKTNYGSTFTSAAGTTYLYDPKANTWTNLDLNADGRLNFASALMANGKVIVTGNVADNSVEILTSLPPMSIKNLAQNSTVEIYPNPTTGLLFIHSKNQQNIHQIEVTDMLGKLIDANVSGLNTNRVSIQLNTQAKGVYFVKINVAGHVETTRIVLEQ